MCGVAFILDNTFQLNKDETINHMMNSIIHRGPDDGGKEVINNVALGFRRLSILDLSAAGHQPMWDKTKRYAIIFNGEIYNYIEIRAELEKHGHQFQSHTDTEALLVAYIQWGQACLQKLNGMFAFLIYDKQKLEVFGARDRFGIKPLYIYQTTQQIFIASEIKALLATRTVNKQINWQVATEYLLHGTLENTDQTFFSGINKIPAGYAFHIDTSSGRYKEWQYWTLQNRLLDSPHLADDYYQIFQDSINLRLRSDVPVGVFLSGGMDSTAIICEMKRQIDTVESQSKLHAYSFISKQFDESHYIEETLKQTQAEIHYLQAKPLELWDVFETALRFHDEPMHSITALVGFKLMKMASQEGIKVILNGQGADEVIAGYPNYFKNFWYSLYSNGDWSKLLSELYTYTKHNGGSPYNLLINIFIKSIRLKIRNLHIYQSHKLKKQTDQAQQDPWYTDELKNNYKQTSKFYHDETLSGALKYSIEQYPLPLYLRIEDRNSMANSIEARLPFLDYRLVELGYSMPDDEKLNGIWNKYILRNAMKNKIPELVRTRTDKMGFPTPIEDWVRGDLYQPFLDIIHSKSMSDNNLYNIEYIKKEMIKHKKQETNIGSRVFRVVQFETWLKLLSHP